MEKFICFILICFAFYSCNYEQKDQSIEKPFSASINWHYADSIKREIKEPNIPSDTFYLSSLVKSSAPQQIQEAVNIVAKSGGGTLVLSKGTYNSGPIKMKSKVELYLEEGAYLKFKPDPELYPLEYTWVNGRPCMNYSSMIYAKNQDDIKISGKGIIDGQGDDLVWKRMKYNEEADLDLLGELDGEGVKPENRKFKFGVGHSLRPDLIAFYECSRITVSGVTIINTPYFILHPVMSNHITIKNALIKSKGYDQIGIALESSQNVLIDSMYLEDFGEGIKILSGSGDMANNQASSNIIIQNSSFKNIAYSPVIFSSKSFKGTNRVFISGLHMDDSEAGISFYGQQNVKIHDIFIKDIVAENIAGSFLYGRIIRSKNATPILYNIQLDNIRVKNCGRAFVMLGREITPIQNVSINNSSLNVSKGSFAKFTKQLSLNNVEMNGQAFDGSFDLEDVKIPKIKFENTEEDILDSDDIQYNDLPVAIKNTLDERYAYVPINDIDRIITSSNVIYEIELELESYKEIELLIQMDGEIIRSEYESSFKHLPQSVIVTLGNYLGTDATPFLLNEVKEIRYRDFTYYEIKGEYNKKLFALGISNEGKVIEQKQQTITSYFLPKTQ